MSEVAQDSAPETDTPDQPKKPVRNMQLMPDRCKNAEFERVFYRIVPPEGHTMEDILKPSYYAHIAQKLKPGDHIEVLPDDMSFYAELIVIASGRAASMVQLLRYVRVGANADSMQVDTEHYVKYRGLHKKWTIIRKSDEAVIREALPTREQAEREMAEYRVQVS